MTVYVAHGVHKFLSILMAKLIIGSPSFPQLTSPVVVSSLVSDDGRQVKGLGEHVCLRTWIADVAAGETREG